MADCRKGEQYGKGLFIESREATDDALADLEQGPEFDAEEDVEEELVQGIRVLCWWLKGHALHPARQKEKIGGATSSNLLVQWEVKYRDLLLIRGAVRTWCPKKLSRNWGWRWKSTLVPTS